MPITVYDPDRVKIKQLQDGICPIVEPEMEDILFKHDIKFEALDTYTWLRDIDTLIIAVGTPTVQGGIKADTSVLDEILKAVHSINPDINIVIKSTIPIRYCDDKVDELGLKIYHIPEFLRQGYAIQDMQRQRHIIVGKPSNATKDNATALAYYLFKSDKISVVSNATAAMAKLARNTFLALHIAYANELNILCKGAGVPYKDLKYLMGFDPRIHTSYMTPGPGYGGSCLPKDTRSLSYQSGELFPSWLVADADIKGGELLHGLVESNLRTTGIAYEWLKQQILESNAKVVTICGLTFKDETDDLRESRYLDIALALAKDPDLSSIEIRLTDTHDATAKYFKGKEDQFNFYSSYFEAIKGAELLVINHAGYTTELPEDVKVIDFTGYIDREDVQSWIAK